MCSSLNKLEYVHMCVCVYDFSSQGALRIYDILHAINFSISIETKRKDNI